MKQGYYSPHNIMIVHNLFLIYSYQLKICHKDNLNCNFDCKLSVVFIFISISVLPHPCIYIPTPCIFLILRSRSVECRPKAFLRNLDATGHLPVGPSSRRDFIFLRMYV